MTKHRCPICHKILTAEKQKRAQEVGFFPFCSRRCKLIDLGKWLDAKYRVISEPCSEESEDSRNDYSDAAKEKP